MKVEDPFPTVNTLIFCDESKFYILDGDNEDAIYYFGVAVDKLIVSKVVAEIKDVLNKNNVKAPVFHAAEIFRNKRPRPKLMHDLMQVIINNGLKCFCNRYSKNEMFEPTKILAKYNNPRIDFNKVEFQALFYFIAHLNYYLLQVNPALLRKEIILYGDRNVYGNEEVEALYFPETDYVFNRMTFSEKSLISLLCLPDFVGYLFRKSKKSLNKKEEDPVKLEASVLVINAFKNLMELDKSNLFYFLDAEIADIEKALQLLMVNNKNVNHNP